MSEFEIIKCTDSSQETIVDYVVEERPFTIYLNQEEWVTLLCSPMNIRELMVGYLFSSGVIHAFSDIKDLMIDMDKFAVYVELYKTEIPTEIFLKRIYTSGCGKGIVFYTGSDVMHTKKITTELTVSFTQVMDRINEFQSKSELFLATGGVHSAAFCTPEHIEYFQDDIGRHNAVDKIIGKALIDGKDMTKMMVLTTGRISSEIIFKVQRTGCPILVSRSAPTDQAVKVARSIDMTLIGFARKGRMNVYSGTAFGGN